MSLLASRWLRTTAKIVSLISLVLFSLYSYVFPQIIYDVTRFPFYNAKTNANDAGELSFERTFIVLKEFSAVSDMSIFGIDVHKQQAIKNKLNVKFDGDNCASIDENQNAIDLQIYNYISKKNIEIESCILKEGMFRFLYVLKNNSFKIYDSGGRESEFIVGDENIKIDKITITVRPGIYRVSMRSSVFSSIDRSGGAYVVFGMHTGYHK